jgi:hypothetical protein
MFINQPKQRTYCMLWCRLTCQSKKQKMLNNSLNSRTIEWNHLRLTLGHNWSPRTSTVYNVGRCLSERYVKTALKNVKDKQAHETRSAIAISMFNPSNTRLQTRNGYHKRIECWKGHSISRNYLVSWDGQLNWDQCIYYMSCLHCLLTLLVQELVIYSRYITLLRNIWNPRSKEH